jgi:hypothetical protein
MTSKQLRLTKGVMAMLQDRGWTLHRNSFTKRQYFFRIEDGAAEGGPAWKQTVEEIERELQNVQG